MAEQYQWEIGLGISKSVGSAIYLNLQDEVELWKEGREFFSVRKNEVRRIFEFCWVAMAKKDVSPLIPH